MKYSNKQQKTDEIIQKAFIKLYKNKTYTEVNVKELCANAGISRTTFYAHYTNINELMREIEQNLIDGIEKNGMFFFEVEFDQNGMVTETTLSGMKEFLCYWHENKEFIAPFISDYGDPYFINKCKELFRKYMLAGTSNTSRRFGTNEEYVFIIFENGVIKTLSHWLENDDVGIEKLTEFYIRIISRNPFYNN